MSDTDQTGTALAEPMISVAPASRTRNASSSETRRPPPYNVVILDDQEHTFDYVVEMLAKVFGHSSTEGLRLAWRIHLEGRAVVHTTHKEAAEFKRDKVLAYGPDPRMSLSSGSLRCLIEPAFQDKN